MTLKSPIALGNRVSRTGTILVRTVQIVSSPVQFGLAGAQSWISAHTYLRAETKTPADTAQTCHSPSMTAPISTSPPKAGTTFPSSLTPSSTASDQRLREPLDSRMAASAATGRSQLHVAKGTS